MKIWFEKEFYGAKEFHYKIIKYDIPYTAPIRYLHREDGPAIDYHNGTNKYWYLNGEYIDCSSQQEFEKYLKLKAFW